VQPQAAEVDASATVNGLIPGREISPASSLLQEIIRPQREAYQSSQPGDKINNIFTKHFRIFF
jgi:hypothetical protein